MIKSRRLALTFVIIAALAAPGATSAASTNDQYRSATVIASLPFSETISTTTATSESGEPSRCFDDRPSNSVWYTYTPPSDQVIRVSTVGSSYDAFPQIYVVNGHGFGGLTPVVPCGTRQLELTGGTTYAIQVTDERPSGGGGNLVLSIEQALPPPNDDFASATRVTALPFTDRVDLAAATLEPGEPAAASCLGYPPMTASAWYAFTPAVDGQLQIQRAGGSESVAVIYTGTAMGTLTQIDCGFFAIAVRAGTTYYIQVAAQSLGKGVIDVTLRQPPPPEASFVFDPAEPNSVDPVSFFDQSFDPAFQDSSHAWTFGDGSTSDLFNPTHRYAADGDYVVGMTITTVDGRTDSTQQTISVRTHDVRITNVTAPKSARSGQTRTVDVSVVDLRYPETVEVRLYRVDEFEQMLVSNAFVELTVTTRATTTSLPYTFTAADAAAGKVTFLVTVVIVGHADALPADNSRIAVTSVKR